MLLPTQAITRAPLGVSMRIREVGLQQRMLRLGSVEVRWEDLPERTRKEVIALLSQLILEHARGEAGIEPRRNA